MAGRSRFAAFHFRRAHLEFVNWRAGQLFDAAYTLHLEVVDGNDHYLDAEVRVTVEPHGPGVIARLEPTLPDPLLAGGSLEGEDWERACFAAVGRELMAYLKAPPAGMENGGRRDVWVNLTTVVHVEVVT